MIAALPRFIYKSHSCAFGAAEEKYTLSYYCDAVGRNYGQYGGVVAGYCGHCGAGGGYSGCGGRGGCRVANVALYGYVQYLTNLECTQIVLVVYCLEKLSICLVVHLVSGSNYSVYGLTGLHGVIHNGVCNAVTGQYLVNRQKNGLSNAQIIHIGELVELENKVGIGLVIDVAGLVYADNGISGLDGVGDDIAVHGVAQSNVLCIADCGVAVSGSSGAHVGAADSAGHTGDGTRNTCGAEPGQGGSGVGRNRNDYLAAYGHSGKVIFVADAVQCHYEHLVGIIVYTVACTKAGNRIAGIECIYCHGRLGKSCGGHHGCENHNQKKNTYELLFHIFAP